MENQYNYYDPGQDDQNRYSSQPQQEPPKNRSPRKRHTTGTERMSRRRPKGGAGQYASTSTPTDTILEKTSSITTNSLKG